MSISHAPCPLVVAPTPMEYAAVHKALKKAQLEHKIQLVCCGMGEANATRLCQGLDPGEVSCLVLLGWAGGLVPGLPVGARVCADRALHAGAPPLACLPLPLAACRTGAMLTSPVALITPQEKQAALPGGALAVEMEAYPLAAWATRLGIPFIHARIILDPLEEALYDTASFMDSSGQLRVGSLLKTTIQHPGWLVPMARLIRRVRALDPLLGNLAIDCIQAVIDPLHP